MMKLQLAILDEFYTKCDVCVLSASVLLEIAEEVIINVSLAVLDDTAFSSSDRRALSIDYFRFRLA